MVIDFHTHIFPEKIASKTVKALADRSGLTPFTTGDVFDLQREMSESGTDISIALPVVTSPEQFPSITRFATYINENFSAGDKKVISFGGIHPADDDYKEHLRELKSLGFSGIKLHPDYQGAFIEDMRYYHIIEEASKLDMIVSVHAGIDIGMPDPVHCPVDQSLRLIKEVQPTKLVLAHLGGWKMWNEVYEKLCGENVWFDTAVAFGICEDDLFEKIVHSHGADKILFATDSPWSGQSESLAYLDRLSLSPEEKEWILCKSAKKLLNMPESTN